MVAINAVAGSLETGGYGERLLCAVFAFKDAKGRRCTSSTTTSAALVSVRAGATEQTGGGSVAAQTGERSTERELQLKAQMAAELPIEPELERWFPLWGIPF